MKSLSKGLIILVLCWIALPTIARKIYIDPGHFIGGKRCDLEIETNLAIALKLKKLLSMDEGWEIEMSRENGKVIESLPDRVKDANEFNADLLISIHCNAVGDDCDADLQATGTETFWCDDKIDRGLDPDGKKSKEFAHLVQKHMVKRGEWLDRRVVEDFSYLRDENGNPYHSYILQNSQAPACLNEIGFVDNAEDRKKLEDDQWREKFALAYRDAIYEYFDRQPPRINLPKDIEINPDIRTDEPEPSISIELSHGWNMISIPGTPVDSDPRSLAGPGSQITSLLEYNGDTGWQKVEELKLGKAYWIKTNNPNGEVIQVPYTPADHYTITLKKGWNLIGSVSSRAAFDDFEGANRLDGRVLRWDPIDKEFHNVFALEPGVGYYVYARVPGTLTVKVGAPDSPAAFWTRPPVSTVELPGFPPMPFETVQTSWSRTNFVPSTSKVLTNFPNPFNPETWIPFQIKQESVVTIHIHNFAGQLVKTLEVGSRTAGVYDTKERAVYWDGTNEQSEPASSGTYFYTLQAEDFQGTKKMLLLK